MTELMDPIFSQFRKYQGPSKPGSTILDFLGTSVRNGFVRPEFTRVHPPVVHTNYPELNEDIVAWVDVLHAVTGAQDSFTMLELGAGYGLWSIRAAKAFRQVSDKKCNLIAVEAEPLHYRWLNLHFQDNGFDPAEHRLINAAIGEHEGQALFFVGSPSGEEFNATNWYGQRLKREGEGTGIRSGEFYEGHPVLVLENGWKCIEVPVITLSTVLDGVGIIDFVHVDLQGHELDVIKSGIELLDHQARHIHIGTHSAEIEEHLRPLFQSHGWQLCADYAGRGRRSSPYGDIDFDDGVQSWKNVRFSEPHR
jgi:FkbM family methyltransferase